jgi:hypothetical protein
MDSGQGIIAWTDNDTSGTGGTDVDVHHLTECHKTFDCAEVTTVTNPACFELGTSYPILSGGTPLLI